MPLAHGPACGRATAAPLESAPRLLGKLWVLFWLPHGAAITLPRFSHVFQSHMVLQRGKPVKVWGYNAMPDTAMTIRLSNGSTTVIQGESISGNDKRWETTLPTPPAWAIGLSMKLTVTRHVATRPAHTLFDVTIGDVYLFTGQSNVDLPESYGLQFNATAQRAEEKWADEMGQKGLLRIMIVPNQVPGLRYLTAPAQELTIVPDCRLCPFPFVTSKTIYKVCHCNALHWARASAARIRGFSALAWFSGAAIARTVKSLKDVPLGLVRSSWGGTKIYRWSGTDALAQCPQHARPQLMPSALFSNMIYPMIRLQFSAIVWMHGASDTGGDAAFLGPSYYACALPAMISDWRAKFERPTLPFVVVELPAYCNERDWATFHTFCDQQRSILHAPDHHLPAMRIAQAASEKLPYVYMVTAMDLGSLHPMGGSIHSDRKSELGDRVALAARAAVYNDTSVVWQAPTAISASLLSHGEVSVRFATRTGERLELNTSIRCPNNILHIYCTGAGFELRINGTWTVAHSASLGSDKSVVLKAFNTTGNNSLNTSSTMIDRVRYAFADWPVCSLRSARSGLPARIFDLPVTGGGAPTSVQSVPSGVYVQKTAMPSDATGTPGPLPEIGVPAHGFESFLPRGSKWPSWAPQAVLGAVLLPATVLVLRQAAECRSRRQSARVTVAATAEEDAAARQTLVPHSRRAVVPAGPS